MFLFLESNTRDNLEQMRKEIADINEKLDTLMSRSPLEKKKLRMEGKIYSFSGGRRSCFKSRESKLSKRFLSVSANDFCFVFFSRQIVIINIYENVSRIERLSYS